jgi:sporulation-control protein spo0M
MFEYVNTDNVLKLNILLIINNSNISNKTFGQNAFSVQSEDKIIFYPTNNFFTIQANQQQQIKLNFNLPKLKLPYALTDLRIISNTDSTKNSFVRLVKNFKAQG